MKFFLVWIISIVGTLVIADRKNLNIILFFFLSLFLGPIALFIAAVSSARSRAGGMSSQPMSNQEARNQLEGIKTTIRLLQDRIDRIEASLKTSGEKQNDAPAEQIVPDSASRAEQPFVDAHVRDPKVPEAWEFIFGKYWLNRIGVVLFVIGIGLFINYTFHYFSAFFKIAIGYFFAVLFLVWGEKLAKSARFNKLAWGILGGAWGLFYLVTYAMHYVPATRVITNPLVELVLLWLVTVCAVQYNLKYRSWIVTAMSYFLGFLTMAIGGLDGSSVFFWAMLIGSLSFLSFKFNWDELLMTGIVGAYTMYTVALRHQVVPLFNGSVLPEQFQIVMGLLVTAWVVFFVTILAKEWKNAGPAKAMLPWILLNTSAFVFFGLKEIGHFKPFDVDMKFSFLLLIGAAHIFAGAGNRLFKKPTMTVVHCALAIALASLAVVIRFKDLSISFWWVTEMLMLFGLGVYYKEIIYRAMGFLLGFGVVLRFFAVDISSSKVYTLGSLVLQHDILAGVVIAACFFAMGLLVNMVRVRDSLAREEKDFYFYAFPSVGALALTTIMADDSPARWLTLHWTLLGLGLLVGGFFLKNRAFRFSALGVLVLACIRIFLYDLAGADTIYKIIVVIFLGAALLGVSFIYSRIKQNT